jgi:hypothetical protein
MLFGIYTHKKEIVTLHLTISSFCFIVGDVYILKLGIAILKRRDFLEVMDVNGRLILKSILRKFWNMGAAFLGF